MVSRAAAEELLCPSSRQDDAGIAAEDTVGDVSQRKMTFLRTDDSWRARVLLRAKERLGLVVDEKDCPWLDGGSWGEIGRA